jgi:hypothetical protein
VTVPAATPGAAMPRAQLADPQHWWPFYERAYQHDLAVRRARATAGKHSTGPWPG